MSAPVPTPWSVATRRTLEESAASSGPLLDRIDIHSEVPRVEAGSEAGWEAVGRPAGRAVGGDPGTGGGGAAAAAAAVRGQWRVTVECRRPCRRKGWAGRATWVLPEVQFAYLHGSALEGLPYHDLDVALYIEPTHSAAQDSFDYEMRLSVELTRAVGFPVDVRALNQAPLGFQHCAIQGDLLLVRDADQLSDYLEGIARRHMEFASLGRAYLLEVLKG